MSALTEQFPDQLPTRQVGPLPFRVVGFADCVSSLLAAGSTERATGIAVHFGNAYTVALADSDPDYAAMLARASSVVLTDGVPVAWVGRRGYPELADAWQRTYGPDVMTAVLDRSGPAGPRHYLLGGTPETLDRLQSEVARRWPAARVVGAASPPFRPLTPAEQAAQDAAIRASGADFVWVGLGTPKQDWEVARLAAAMPVIAMAVGAAFDFLSGSKPQAPVWMQRSGTEWAFRLASEPRRLARRYLWGNPRFLLAAHRTPGLVRPR